MDDDASDFDADGDGYDSVDYGGDDCDDTEASVNPGAEEIWYDGIDGDCDGANDEDADGDGFTASEDCDDAQAEIYPDAVGYVDCDKLSDLNDIIKGGGCSGCATQPARGGSMAWLGLFGLLLGWRRR